MGLPLWKMAAEMTGGAMTVESVPGAGTTVTAVFGLSHIDRLPLGDLPQTMPPSSGGSPEKVSGWNLTMMGRGSRPIPGSTVRCWGRRLPGGAEVLAFITGQVAEGIAECCPAPEKL